MGILNIVVDDREPTERMVPLLEKVGFDSVEVKRLNVGDYIIDDRIYFSLKSYGDFLTSLHTGHLHKEIGDLLMLPNTCWIGLIVWRLEDDKKWSTHIRKNKILEVKRRVETINFEYLPVWDVGHRSTAVEVMYRWALKMCEKEFPIQFRRPLEVMKTDYSAPVHVLCGIEGVGPELAKAIQKEYTHLDVLIDAIRETHCYNKEKWKTKKQWREENWYSKIPGLADGKAKTIAQSLVHDVID